MPTSFIPTSLRCVIVALLCGLASTESPCSAADAGAQEPPGQSFFLFGPAVAEIVDPHPRAMGFAEYRYEPAPLRPGPWLALEATARDLFVGFGAFIDIPIGAEWLFTPSIGAAIYRDNDGLGLGSPLELRFTAEFTRRLEHGRIGASVSHFSNGRTAHPNPGTEVLKIIWVVPLKHGHRD